MSPILLCLMICGFDGRLTATDLPAYLKALADDPAQVALTNEMISFRELWESPKQYQGRLVKVEGKSVRRFRQEAVGDFPDLVELWIVNSVGDPICLVFPDSQETPALGQLLEFRGRFLRMVRYSSSDNQERLAPVIVGPLQPKMSKKSDDASQFSEVRMLDSLGLGFALILALVVALILLSQHARRPRAIITAKDNEEPSFVDREDPAL